MKYEIEAPSGLDGFSKRLKILLFVNGMKQVELAEKLGLTTNGVSSLVRGRYYPSCETLVKLKEIFGCSIDYLLEGEEEA